MKNEIIIPLLYVALAVNLAIPPLLLMYEIHVHGGSWKVAVTCPVFYVIALASLGSALLILLLMPAPSAFVGPFLFILSAPIAAFLAEKADRKLRCDS